MKKLLSFALALMMVLSMIPVSAMAAENTEWQYAPSAVADGDTRYTYTDIFNQNNTRYDGRIWTDKTVSTEALRFTGNVHELGDNKEYHDNNNVVVEKDAGEDFLVSYSALASTTTVLSETDAPIDLVMVLDLSAMSNSQEGKLDSLLSAVQSAASHMMELNPSNRIAIVAYSSQAETLLPLGHYDSILMSRDGAAPSRATVVTCTYAQGGVTTSKTFNVSYQNGTPVNKYTQMGVYAGMNLLLTEENTSVIFGEGQTTVTRQPALILLSEGEPKLGSTKIQEPTRSTVQTDGTIVTNNEPGLSTSYDSSKPFIDRVEIMRNNGIADKNASANNDRHAQTFATLLTAAYMKKAVSEHYFGESTGSMQVYTMGINTASANSPRLAQIVLNPRIYLANGALNTLSSTFIGYADSYFGQAHSVSVINAGNKQTVFEYDAELGLNNINDLMYNDGYYDVVGSNNNYDWDSVFDTVLSQVTQNTAKVPTLVEQTDVTGHKSGWLSYTDPIGEYMEVKDVKALIIDDVIYRADRIQKSTQGGTTVYVVNGTANNPVYGNHALSDIQIYVTTDKSGRQEFHVDIPAALLPLRQTTVTENIAGQVIGFTHNNAYPFRLVYSVGLKSDVLNDDGSVNMEKIAADYIQANTVDGEVQFYEGYYGAEGQPGDVNLDDKTIGNAYVTYTPALENPFYYVTEDTPLYLDEACEQPATEYDGNATYYFKITYYEAVSNPADSGVQAIKQTDVVSRPASTLQEDSTYVTLISGQNQLCIKEGEPRLGNLADFRREKADNKTGTAQVYLYLYYDEENSIHNHSFKVFHGNNGRRSAPLPDGTLTVTKQVVGNPGEDQPTFEFEITAHYADDTPVTGEVNGVIFTDGRSTFTLTAGKSKTFSLRQNDTEGVKWTVEEITPGLTADKDGSGWSTKVTVNGTTQTEKTASGTLTPSGSQSVTFTNTYTTPTGTLVVRKEANDSTSQFAFTLTAEGLKENDAILSGGEPIELVQNSYSFTLGNAQSRSFTIPEDVEWTVTEDSQGERWATTVSVDGTPADSPQAASGTMEQGAEHTVTFRNTYTAPGSLVVSKTVEGGDYGQTYQFSVQIGNGMPETITLRPDNNYTHTYPDLANGTRRAIPTAGPPRSMANPVTKLPAGSRAARFPALPSSTPRPARSP